MSAARRLRGGGLLVALVFTSALIALSRVPWTVSGGDGGRLRLSWQAASARVEACRPPTEEELAALPRHMRMSEICEGRLLPFRLRLWIDGDLVLDEPVRPRGARGDRPLSVLRELPVAAGPHTLRVRFEPAATGDPPASGDALDAAASLALRAQVVIAPREVLLVTRYAGGLILRRAP